MRLLEDRILIELDPEKEVVRGGIICVGTQPIRMAKALAVGPGRKTRRGNRVPMQVKPGDRFPCIVALTQTGSGRSIAKRLPEGQNIIRESDILFLVEGDVEISL